MIERPILGISMGDPFGNGPEITVKALNDKTIYDRCRPLIVGDKTSMEYALAVAKKVDGIEDIPYGKGYVFVKDLVRELLEKLDQLKAKGVNVVLTAHYAPSTVDTALKVSTIGCQNLIAVFGGQEPVGRLV